MKKNSENLYPSNSWMKSVKILCLFWSILSFYLRHYFLFPVNTRKSATPSPTFYNFNIRQVYYYFPCNSFTPALIDGLSLEWVKANLLNSQRLFSVFWLISTIQYFRWSSFVLQFPTLPSTPITISIIITFIFHNFLHSQARLKYLSFF